MTGKVYLVGIGPGGRGDMTLRAVETLEGVPTVIGHKYCLGLLGDIVAGKEIIADEMTPIERSRIAAERALAGEDVAIVTVGDPGIYAIASTFLGYLLAQDIKLEVEVIPGVAVANAAAALLGSPLGNDFAAVSLADQANRWDDTLRRLEAAAEADFVVVVYNPQGKLQDDARLREALAVLMKHRAKSTPVGIVTNASLAEQKIQITTLGRTPDCCIDAHKSILIVGNSRTVVYDNKMFTRRDYIEGVGY
jgi:precorrin-3B C17-methyltransferase